jgi:hypothetical protein
MAPLAELDEAAYEVAQVQIGYCKLFPLIMEDFLTREDAKIMMGASNLSVSSIVNTAVQVVIPAGSGTGVGGFNTTVQATYKGGMPQAPSHALAEEKRAIKNAGGTSIQKTIGEV